MVKVVNPLGLNPFVVNRLGVKRTTKVWDFKVTVLIQLTTRMRGSEIKEFCEELAEEMEDLIKNNIANHKNCKYIFTIDFLSNSKRGAHDYFNQLSWRFSRLYGESALNMRLYIH